MQAMAAPGTTAKPGAAPTNAATAPVTPAFPPSQLGAIDAALRAVPTQRGLDADTRKQAEDLLRQAQADETHADELAQQWQTLSQTAASADADAQKVEESLAADSGEAMTKWRAALPEGVGLTCNRPSGAAGELGSAGVDEVIAGSVEPLAHLASRWVTESNVPGDARMVLTKSVVLHDKP